MASSQRPRLTVVLLHHPVLNRLGESISSTVDHFDVMDASRLALTYALWRLYVVTPVPAQRALVERLIRHGNAEAERQDGRGTFSTTHWAPDLDTVLADHDDELECTPTVVATSAKAGQDDIPFAALRTRLWAGEPIVLLIGKAWGLAPAVFERADLRLAPIDAGTGYNHLSVRSATAILVDRLMAPTSR